MAENSFVRKTLDTLFKVVEVEFKVPLLGFGEIKLPVTNHAKEWWKNKKRDNDLKSAIRHAEESFIAAYPDNKLAQILHGFPLYSDKEFQNVISGLLTHLEEDNITWLAEVKLEHEWDKLITREEIRQALELYIPLLRHELNGIKEFREIISARILEGLDKKADQILQSTEKIDKTTERIEGKLDEALKSRQDKPITLNTGWFYGHQYGDIEFTGRDEERKMLKGWLDDKKDNLLIFRALGGFGKTSLAWEWFNKDVDRQKWHTAFWWSFYEKESGFEKFLDFTLGNLGFDIKDSSPRQKINDLLEIMQQTNILIVVDGFERLLRQYAGMDAIYKGGAEDEEEIQKIDPSQRDCASLTVENFLRGLSSEKLQSKILMTTRLTPRVLENKSGKLLKRCREEPLEVFKEGDAILYFKNENIKATRAEVLEVSKRYGFHPLSLNLLVGFINQDHENQGDIVAVKQLDIFGDIKANRHHILERAFESLTLERRELLSKLSCFRGSVKYDTIKKLFNTPDLDKSLIDLRKRGLLKYTNETKTYDMHPIVRHYVYDRFTDKDRRNTHVELAMHFIDEMPVTNKNVKTLEDLAPVIELYHHMVRAGNLDEAMKLFYDRLHDTLYYQFGAYQLMIELTRALFPDGEDKTPRLQREDAQAWAPTVLANAYALSGQPRRAVPLFLMGNEPDEKRGDKQGIAIGLGNVATQQLDIGALSAAERSLRRSIDLCREIAEEHWGGVGHSELGRVLIYLGHWDDSEKELSNGLLLFEKLNHIQDEGYTWAYRVLRFLLVARSNPQSKTANLKSAIECAQRALGLADEDTKQRYPHPRDYVRAHWLLGAAYCANKDLTLAEENLSKALNLCRQINMVDHEANILLDLARLRYTQGDFKDAQEKASEALMITERSGYVLQGADVNLFLAELTMSGHRSKVEGGLSDKDAAIFHAEEALRLATCDGPPYYYKVAYEEAERFLENLK